MDLIIKMNLDNAAFSDGNSEHEQARILRKLADDIEKFKDPSALWDLNGNRVGTVEYIK
jgi:hypothetical protein